MNKEVLYIEPEDDITDIITKIEKSKEKIVALVPPKKAGVFRSVVNIKLINKAGKTADKTIVLVTTDPSIVKLAAATKLPVTKDLQTAPVIPKETDDEDNSTGKKEELIEESDGTVETEEDVEELEGGDKNKSAEENSDDDTDVSDSEDEDDDADKVENGKVNNKSGKKKTSKERNKPKSNNKIIAWIQDHKKIVIIGGAGALGLILLLIWALVLAPRATVTVGVRTTSNNFSETVTFTTALADEDASTGKFYLEEQKVETSETVEFEATGKKNIGEKATGSVVIYAYFPLNIKGSSAISTGAKFTISGLSFSADEAVAIVYSGNGYDECDNRDNPSALINSGCQVSARVPVTADEPGTAYNIAASNSGWTTTAQVGVYSDKPMSGGTDQEVTIVQQSDVDKAKESLAGANLEQNKAKLLEKLGENVMIIDASLAQSTSEAEATPKVGEEVKDGVKPTLKANTITSLFVIDKTKVEEFITEKANLADDQKIYEMKDPFIENFMKSDSGYTGKLKTSYMTGPKLTTTSIVELVRGRGFGDAQHVLKDIDGVTDVRIDGSFPWVTSIPNDTNKITVNLEIKDQNGNKVEQKTEKTDGKDAKNESADKKSENGNKSE